MWRLFLHSRIWGFHGHYVVWYMSTRLHGVTSQKTAVLLLHNFINELTVIDNSFSVAGESSCWVPAVSMGERGRCRSRERGWGILSQTRVQSRASRPNDVCRETEAGGLRGFPARKENPGWCCTQNTRGGSEVRIIKLSVKVSSFYIYVYSSRLLYVADYTLHSI